MGIRNVDIRARAKLKKVKLWQVAERLNLSDSEFSRKLRRELSEETKAKIFRLIDELAKEEG